MVTEDDCIHALREAAQLLGDSPTKAQYEELGLTPSASTILRQCGGWNAAKRRAGLATNYSRGSRVEPKPDGVDLPEGLVWDELSQDQRWHYRNREWNTERSLQRRRRLRLWLNEQKQERGCENCGESDPACLDYHHRDAEQKVMRVSKAVTWGYSQENLKTEIDKCDVLCANCHRLKHHTVPDGITEDRGSTPQTNCEPVSNLTARQRATVHRFKRHEGCRRCSESRPGCLDLHHEAGTTKVESISHLISNNCSVTELRAELRKCIVLCANCHRRDHYQGPLPE